LLIILAGSTRVSSGTTVLRVYLLDPPTPAVEESMLLICGVVLSGGSVRGSVTDDSLEGDVVGIPHLFVAEWLKTLARVS
jgi:hypothetical protein